MCQHHSHQSTGSDDLSSGGLSRRSLVGSGLFGAAVLGTATPAFAGAAAALLIGVDVVAGSLVGSLGALGLLWLMLASALLALLATLDVRRSGDAL